MDRIRPLEDSELRWWMRLFKWIAARKVRLNQPSKAVNLLAHHPSVCFANVGFMGVMTGWDRLPMRLKRLVHLRVAMRVGCVF